MYVILFLRKNRPFGEGWQMIEWLYFEKSKAVNDLNAYRSSKRAVEDGYAYSLFKLSEVGDLK